MLRNILILSLFMILFSTNNAMAEDDGALIAKVAVVDVQKILSESDASKSIFEQVKDRKKELTVEFAGLEKKFNKMKGDLIEKKDSFSKEEFEKKGREFEEKVFKTNKLAQQRKAEIDIAFNKGLEQIKAEVTKIVSSVSEKRGFNLVLTSNNVIIFEQSIDLTIDVMDDLNSKLKTVDLDFGGEK